MNIYRKKVVAGIMAATLMLGLMPGSLALADTATDTKTDQAAGSITPSGLTTDTLESTIDTYVKEYIGTAVPGAVVTITKDKEVIYNKSYGYSNLDEKKEIDPDATIVKYGELSQIYTWTAVLQLVEQGKLDLEADILTYLPENFATELKEHLIGTTPITLTNLMNHTAGFEELGHDNTFNDSSKLESNLEKALIKTMPNQIYGPGQTMTGDNYSVALAAYIVEQVSGSSFTDYVQTNILDKIGAKNTAFVVNESVAKDLTDNKGIQYSKDTEGNFAVETTTFSNLYPADSVYGTTSDLVKLMNQLIPSQESSLLSQQSLDTMYSKSYAVNELAKAALHGLYQYPADVAAYYCDGGTSSTSMMVTVPENGLGIVITTNTDTSLELLYGLTYKLLIGDTDAKVSPVDDLPLVEQVINREYVGSRRPYSGPLEFVGYFANCSYFDRVDQHTISLGNDKYVQVAPYVYKYSGDNDSPLYKTISSTIYFQADTYGKGTKWSYGASGMAEYVYSVENKSQNYISMTIFLLIVSILFVVIAVLVSVIGLIRDAVKRRFKWKGVRLAYTIFVVLLFLTFLNNWTFLSDISSVHGIMASSINIHIVFNIILSALELIGLAYLVFRTRNERQSKMRNLMTIFTVLIYIGSVYFLLTWSFYTMI